MDIDRHLSVLWQRRAIVLGGLALGVVSALLAAYSPTSGGLERRGGEQWSTSSTLFVTQKGFPWGRVTAAGDPEQGAGAAGASPTPRRKDGAIPFDPARLTNLAHVYAAMATSDDVRRMLPGPPSAGQIEATPIDPTQHGDALLPILQLTTTGDSSAAAHRLNGQAVGALKQTLLREQREHGIPAWDRVQIQSLKAAHSPVLVSGPSWAPSLLALFLCVGAAIALAHLVEGLSMARRGGDHPAATGASAIESIADDRGSVAATSGARNGAALPTVRLAEVDAHRDRPRDG